MYRRPKFLELLLDIRQRMAREADYDVDLFAAKIRGGSFRAEPLAMTDERHRSPSAGKTRRKVPDNR